jgi:hypothetical protein
MKIQNRSFGCTFVQNCHFDRFVYKMNTLYGMKNFSSRTRAVLWLIQLSQVSRLPLSVELWHGIKKILEHSTDNWDINCICIYQTSLKGSRSENRHIHHLSTPQPPTQDKKYKSLFHSLFCIFTVDNPALSHFKMKFLTFPPKMKPHPFSKWECSRRRECWTVNTLQMEKW